MFFNFSCVVNSKILPKKLTSIDKFGVSSSLRRTIAYSQNSMKNNYKALELSKIGQHLSNKALYSSKIHLLLSP